MTPPDEDCWTVCAHCGADLGVTEWPPVVDTTGNDSDTVIHSFCDEACRAAWNAD